MSLSMSYCNSFLLALNCLHRSSICATSRDRYILSTVSGSAFMDTFNSVYYTFSPQVTKNIQRGQPWLQDVVKIALYPLFGILMTAEKGYATLGGEATQHFRLVSLQDSLIGAVYLWPIGLAKQEG